MAARHASSALWRRAWAVDLNSARACEHAAPSLGPYDARMWPRASVREESREPTMSFWNRWIAGAEAGLDSNASMALNAHWGSMKAIRGPLLASEVPPRDLDWRNSDWIGSTRSGCGGAVKTTMVFGLARWVSKGASCGSEVVSGLHTMMGISALRRLASGSSKVLPVSGVWNGSTLGDLISVIWIGREKRDRNGDRTCSIG